MARTKQSAARSTGGRTPRRSLARLACRKVSSQGAATEQRWHVWLITDRLGTDVTDDSRYSVQFIVTPGKTQSSYEPRWMLEEDGFGEYLDLVDTFKALGGPMTFAEFALSRPDEFSQAIGAANDGRCAFHALSRATDAVGLVGWFSGAAVDEFYDAQAAKGKPIPGAGVVWSTLWTFVRQQNRSARAAEKPEICEDTLRVNQVQERLTGVSSCLGLDNLLLAPGVYLCAGSSPGPQRKSHAFTMIVTTAGRFASDDEVVQVPLLEYAASWLAEVRFVRRVLIR
ncbi:hypothetical protein PF005_g18584 [Phytophthora fragariae]|uniref:Uncharacterized protein n=1 Tax=Phytophthora fragariae TaxID=53985 RepID=A0A6A3RJS6_9STRA|nr:hypothetical protein PF003_g3435 [Phytophthora fragariae]KAE8930405.1 hypothetical protein PF009_g19504 [Phytophthora fragariae]KAE8992528.1 hypothetical protein PF011_g17520 [Phytophthora fragariae]KAE9092235.1 hypothetical protein PF010_g17887 [Phytophthora fragariae]KAE9097738.1 hypothetical protein PF007_g16521 [Phytophthora fragariae]